MYFSEVRMAQGKRATFKTQTHTIIFSEMTDNVTRIGLGERIKKLVIT